MIDIKRIVGDHLRDAGLRASYTAPADRSTAYTRIRMVNAPESGDGVDHLVPYLLQLDVYAGDTGGYPEAWDTADAVRRELRALEGYADTDGVITRVQIIGATDLPDSEGFEAARERIAITAELTGHEVGAGS